GVGVGHAADVTDLAGEVEDDRLTANQDAHAVLVADVGDVDPGPPAQAVEMGEIAAMARDERVDHEHPRPQVDEPLGQVPADEPEPAGNHHPPLGVEVFEIAGQFSVPRWLVGPTRASSPVPYDTLSRACP